MWSAQRSALVTLAVLLSVLASTHAILRCQNFDTFTVGSVYANSTGFLPARPISREPVLMSTEKFFADHPKARIYGNVTVVNSQSIPEFANQPSITGSSLWLYNVSLEFDFRNVSKELRPRYISIEFFDKGILQNVRANNGTVYKGSLVSTPNSIAEKVMFFTLRGRRFVYNFAEFYSRSAEFTIDRIWIGGDRLAIDNFCWDNDWHTPPAVVEDNAASSVFASTLLVAAITLFGLLFV